MRDLTTRSVRRSGDMTWKQGGLLRGVLGVFLAVPVAVAGQARPQYVGLRHRDRVVTGVDEMNLTGDAGRRIAKQIERCASEFVEGHARSTRTHKLAKG